MCGRYYVDDDTAREIERLVRQVDEKMKRKTAACRVGILCLWPDATGSMKMATGS